uniref:Uncharacterized protein n=1 Tax=Arundo donax TaxID=35708 RepID=A0A0A9EX32_ARUDO
MVDLNSCPCVLSLHKSKILAPSAARLDITRECFCSTTGTRKCYKSM